MNQRKVYNTTLLKDKTKQNEFGITLNNRFQPLEKLIEDETVEEQWEMVKEAVTSPCQQVLGSKKYTDKDWKTTDTLEEMDERKKKPTIRWD